MEAVDLLIRGGYVVTQNAQGDEYPNGAVAIRGRDIVAVGPAGELAGRYRPARVIDANERVIFPGLINTHTHLFQTFMRGLGEGLHVHRWIMGVTVPGIRAMTDRDFYLSTMIGCMESIRSGVTTVLEYSYPNPYHGMYDVILEGMRESGIRGLLGRGVADIPATGPDAIRNGMPPELLEPVSQAMDDCHRLWKLCQERGEGRIGFCLAPPHMRCETVETLAGFRAFAKKTGCIISMHICETPRDDEVIGERHGLLAVQWLEGLGFLGPDLLAVHCVHLVDDGIRRFAANGVKVSYNPVSNTYMGNGIPPIPKLREQGVVVSMATDGAASNNAQDMLEVMKIGTVVQRAATRNPGIWYGRDALQMATINGAKAMGMEKQIGSLEAGKRADVVIANFLTSKSAPYYDPVNTLVFSSDPRVIETVVIDGKVVLEDGQFTMLDEAALVREAQEAGCRLAERAYAEDVLRKAGIVWMRRG